MKTSVTILVTSALLFLSLTTADVLQQLKLTQQEANDYVLQTVQFERLSYPSSARSLPATARVEVAKGVLSFAKAYTQTAAFKNEYAAWWKNQEPEAPATVEQRLKDAQEEKERSEKSADEGETNMRKQISETTDPQLKKTLQDALTAYIESRKQMEAQMQTPEMKQMMADMAVAQKKQYEEDFKKETEEYKKKYADWQSRKDPNATIRKMLKAYIDLAATVDFSAQTIANQQGLKMFVKPEYQSKSAEWKMCYRAGKELNDAVRPLVQQWLGELK